MTAPKPDHEAARRVAETIVYAAATQHPDHVNLARAYLDTAPRWVAVAWQYRVKGFDWMPAESEAAAREAVMMYGKNNCEMRALYIPTPPEVK
jgi:hypothetical protein